MNFRAQNLQEKLGVDERRDELLNSIQQINAEGLEDGNPTKRVREAAGNLFFG